MAEFLQSSSTLMTANPISKDESYNLALAAASAADDRKGGDIVLLRVAEVSYLADYFVMITQLYSR